MTRVYRLNHQTHTEHTNRQELRASHRDTIISQRASHQPHGRSQRTTDSENVGTPSRRTANHKVFVTIHHTHMASPPLDATTDWLRIRYSFSQACNFNVELFCIHFTSRGGKINLHAIGTDVSHLTDTHDLYLLCYHRQEGPHHFSSAQGVVVLQCQCVGSVNVYTQMHQSSRKQNGL